jgi:glycosyltransferase involved in cell wall biosynthesis
MSMSSSAAKPQAGRRSAIILTLGTPGGIDRQIEYFTSRAADALPDWELTTFATHRSRWRSILTLPGKLMLFMLMCLRRSFTPCHVNLAPHGSTLRKSFYCAACDVLGIPYVIHLHGSNYHEFFAAGGRARKAFIRRLFRRAAHVIVLGDVWQRFVMFEIGVPRDKITVVPNAVPGPDVIEPRLRQSPPVILFLGIVGERKGVDVLLDALAAPDLAPLAWSAVIAGDGEVERYKARAGALGLADRVTFSGWCGTQVVRTLLQQAGILVLPSRAENLPLSLLEGMAYGLCPVVTPVGAVPEVVDDGNNGLLVPIGDAKALSTALTAVLASPLKRTRMADAARATYLQRYDVQQYPQRLGEVYRKVALRRSPRLPGEDGFAAQPRRAPRPSETVSRRVIFTAPDLRTRRRSIIRTPHATHELY